MSDPRDFSVDLAAGVGTRIEARGRFFGIIEAPSAVLDVQLDSRAPLRRGPGGSILLSDFFSRVTLTSALAQTVRVLIADETQDVSNIVTGGGGSPTLNVTVDEAPSAAVATPAADVIANTSALSIAANSARLRITICSLSTNAGSVFVQATGAGAGRGIELQPGLILEFRTTAALDVRNDSGAAVTVTRFEET